MSSNATSLAPILFTNETSSLSNSISHHHHATDDSTEYYDDDPFHRGDRGLFDHADEEYDTNGHSFLHIIHSWKFATSVVMSICCLGGLCGNAISTVIFFHRSMRNSPINFLLASVSIIDLCVLLLIIPMLILPNMNFYFQRQELYQFYLRCVLIAYPIVLMSQTASTWTYVLVVVERYVAVCQPLKTYKLLTMSQAKKAQAVIILASILYNVVRFFEYRRTEDGQLEDYLRANSFYFLLYYASLHLATHFLLPLSIIIVLNVRIVRTLTVNSTNTSCSNSSTNRPAHVVRLRRSAGNAAIHSRRQSRTAWMIVVATGAFVLTNSLTFLVSLWEAVEPGVSKGDGYWSTMLHGISDLANILLVSHSACSFLIYMVFCRQYRSLFRRMMMQVKDTLVRSMSGRSTSRRSTFERSDADWQRLGIGCGVSRAPSATYYSPTQDGEGRLSVFRTRTVSTVASSYSNVPKASFSLSIS